MFLNITHSSVQKYVCFIITSFPSQLALLDFGACREYSKDFVDKYINLIHGAAVKDRDQVLKYSQELGFLTGYEAKVSQEFVSYQILVMVSL